MGAEAYLDAEVTQAVITVPAAFTSAQREATQAATTMAGLQVQLSLSQCNWLAESFRLLALVLFLLSIKASAAPSKVFRRCIITGSSSNLT